MDAVLHKGVKYWHGPFVETGEYLPCIGINGFLFRVEIIGPEHVLFFWDDNKEVWEEIMRTKTVFRLSTLVPALDDFFYIRSLADQEEEF